MIHWVTEVTLLSTANHFHRNSDWVGSNINLLQYVWSWSSARPLNNSKSKNDLCCSADLCADCCSQFLQSHVRYHVTTHITSLSKGYCIKTGCVNATEPHSGLWISFFYMSRISECRLPSTLKIVTFCMFMAINLLCTDHIEYEYLNSGSYLFISLCLLHCRERLRASYEGGHEGAAEGGLFSDL